MTPSRHLIARLTILGAVCSTLVSTPSAIGGAGQQTQRPLLRVRVIDGVTLEPVSGVAVGFRCFDAYPNSTRFTVEGLTGQTDAQGEVVFDAGEPGVCIVLNTLKPGFFQRVNENTRPYDVGPGETLRVLRIWKRPALAGRLLDERGLPLADVPLFLAAPRSQNPNGRPAAITDAQGRFIVESLSASTPYTLLAPSIALTQPAPVIALRPGETRNDLELRGTLRPRFRVGGRVRDATGSPQDATVYLDLADRPSGYPETIATRRADRTGAFLFPDVPAGSYRIRVDTGGPGTTRLAAEALWAEMSVTVTRDVTDLAVKVDRMPEVRGLVQFEGASQPPPGTRTMLRFDPVDGPGGRMMAGMIEVVDRQFRAAGLRPGRYLLAVALLPQGWRLQSAMTGGRDVSEVPLEITPDFRAITDLVVTLTERRTSLVGAVKAASDEDDREASVIVFSANHSFWEDRGPIGRRVRQALTNSRGRYAFASFPPGEYLVAAVATDDLPNQQQVPNEWLPRLEPLATRVRIDYDATVNLDLRRVATPR